VVFMPQGYRWQVCCRARQNLAYLCGIAASLRESLSSLSGFAMNNIEYITSYGELAQKGVHRGRLPVDFTMNSPVGIARDLLGRVWVCDTGNSRVLVFSASLNELLHEIHETRPEGADKATSLLMPFHLCPHPEQNLMYFTDMGNGRVVVYAYDEDSVTFSFAF